MDRSDGRVGRKGVEGLLTDLKEPGPTGRYHCCVQCPGEDLAASCRLLHEAGARLLTLAAIPGPDGEIGLTYTFELHDNDVIEVGSATRGHVVDSLFSLFACADFLEREVNHLFGVKFLGHPNLAAPGAREATVDAGSSPAPFSLQGDSE